MKQEVKEIYTRLSGGKRIDGDAYVITQGQFNSVLLDRFVAELTKKGVKWDGRDIAFGELMAGGVAELPTGDPNQRMQRADQPLAANTPESRSTKPADFAIGIDIQQVAELPDCIDYWEDEFYKLKFTPEEIAYAVTRNDPKETFAGIYSCKEAVIKCNQGLEWDSIAITRDANGGPIFADYHLSIAHSAGTAIAIAVLKKAGSQAAAPESDRRVSGGGATVASNDNAAVEKRRLPKAVGILFVLISLVILYLLYRDFIR